MARGRGPLTRPILPVATGLVVAAVTIGTVSWTLTGHESGPKKSHGAVSAPEPNRQTLQRASRNKDRTEATKPSDSGSDKASGSGGSDKSAKDTDAHGDQSSAAGQYGSCSAGFVTTGTNTANGDKFDADADTAANMDLPFGSKVRITNEENGKSVVVKINDRGPYVDDRCFDLTVGAYSKIAPLADRTTTIDYVVIS